MAFPSVSYTRDTPAGYPGMIATTEPKWITSMIVASDSADIPFGVPVVYGTENDTVKMPTAGGKFAGISIADRTVPAQDGAVFKPYTQLSLMKGGAIWVTAAVAVVQGDPVYMTPTGGMTNASSGNQLINGAEWATATTAANQIAKIRLGVTK